MTSLYSWLGHRGRELIAHADRLRQPAAPGRRIIIFPGDSVSGTAADLRAIAMAPALRRLGWRATCVPNQLELGQRLRIVRAERPDLILLQQSRHPLNRPRYYKNIPCIFDADDADIHDPRCEEAVIECCRDSAAIIAGSRYLANLFRAHNPNVAVVWTGTYLTGSEHAPRNEDRPATLAWAPSNALGYPREAEFVRDVLLRLADRHQFTFFQYGVRDEQRDAVERLLAPVRDAGISVQIFRPMPYQEFARSLERVTVGLHPICVDDLFSRGKSFGKLLAYLTANVAVVTSDAADHPLFFRHGESGMLFPEDVGRWADGCAQLLEQPAKRAKMVDAARTDFLARLTTAKAAELVSEHMLRTLRAIRSEAR